MIDSCSDLPDDDPKKQLVAQAIDEAEVMRPGPLGPQTETPPPIVFLGYVTGTYHFISKDGEQRAFTARELIHLNIASLFGGDTKWLCENFPVRNKDKEIIPGSFSAKVCAEWLMAVSSAAGPFNPETPMRRLGVWRSRSRVVVHMGTSIWYNGEKRKSGCVIDGAIYPTCGHLKEPDFEKPADRFDAQRIRASLNAWAFTEKYDADLLFGFLGAALLGGFPQWRVHALVTGERGRGKSTLGRYIMDAIGAQGTSLNEYTEAGVRQKLVNESRTLCLDEGESGGEEQAHRMAKVIGLLRKMSDGDGARIVRGTSGGTALNSTVTGCVLLLAINPPPLQPQDRSRIFTVSLDKPSAGASSEDIRAMAKEAADLSPRLRARALIGATRFAGTFELYRKCLIEHGCDARQSDLFATLCAGRSLLLDDTMPARSAAEEFITGLSHRLRLIMLDDSEVSDGNSCLNRLLDAGCAAIRDGIKRSIGQLVTEGVHSQTQPENDKLMPLGLRVITDKSNSDIRYFFVANDHVELRRIFHNTPWADGNWRASLMRLPGVRPSPVPVSVGRKARGLLIPKSLLPDYDKGNDIDLSHPPDDPSPPVPAPHVS